MWFYQRWKYFIRNIILYYDVLLLELSGHTTQVTRTEHEFIFYELGKFDDNLQVYAFNVTHKNPFIFHKTYNLWTLLLLQPT